MRWADGQFSEMYLPEIGNGEDIESAAKLVSELLVDNSSFYMVREAWRICKQEMINLICFIRR